MPKHVMIDLETLSTAPNAMIISIGAVAFDPLRPSVEMDPFHVAIDPSRLYAQTRQLFDVDPSTVMWWMADARAAPRVHWNAMEKTDLAEALIGFATWWDDVATRDEVKADDNGVRSMPVWGNGAAFDNVILRQAFERLQITTPWGYHHDRCYRTLKSLARGVTMPEGRHEIGGLHTALFDADRQARHLQTIFELAPYLTV